MDSSILQVLGGLSGNIFSSEIVEIKSDKEALQEPQPKVKINEAILKEGTRIGNRSSVSVYQIHQSKKDERNPNEVMVVSLDADKCNKASEGANPYDINLTDPKEAILFSQSLNKFNFNDFNPYTSRHVVVTKNAVRVYENKTKAQSTYGKPLLAVPLSAVKKIEKIMFDVGDDQRMEKVDQKTNLLNKNLFELQLKDEFLPIYTHQQYSKMFKETSMTIEFSPDKKKGFKYSGSPMQEGASKMMGVSGSRMTSGPSPGRAAQILDMHKKTGVELRESPSKNSKIAMKYINNYPDVGPILAQQAITKKDLEEMSKNLDKKEMWIRSDLRLIFAVEDSQVVEESIEQLNKILNNE